MMVSLGALGVLELMGEFAECVGEVVRIARAAIRAMSQAAGAQQVTWVGQAQLHARSFLAARPQAPAAALLGAGDRAPREVRGRVELDNLDRIALAQIRAVDMPFNAAPER